MPFPIYLFILIELLFVSWGDVKTNKIPNIWSILNLVAFVILLFIVPDFYKFKLETFVFSTVFLIIGFILFLLKIMGGGDSKFLFTFFLLVPLAIQEMTFNYLLLSTVTIGTFVFITNIVKNFDKLKEYLRIKDYIGMKSCFGTKFSYAPVILIAWLLVGWNIRAKFGI
jgi:prepilin peptidase CpaA